MSGYFDALMEAYQQGHTYQDIATYHAAQGWQAPQQVDIAQLMQTPNLGMAQYNTNIAAQAYKNMGQSEEEVLAQPRETPVQPTWDQPTGTVSGDAIVPGSLDTDAEGEAAPWENGFGSWKPTPAQDI